VPTLRTTRATSAGGVVYRPGPRGVEIVIVHRRQPRLWALPKGTPNVGETLQQTAVRETREETGLHVAVEEPIRSISYFFVRGSIRFHKTVHFYLMRPIGGDLAEHDHEFDEVRWAPVDEALGLLTHATERAVAERAATLLSARDPGARIPSEVAG